MKKFWSAWCGPKFLLFTVTEGVVGHQEGGADDGGGDCVGDGGGEALLEDAVHAFGIEQDLQHRGDAGPADHMDGQLAQVEPDQIFPIKGGGAQPRHIGQDAQQTAEGPGGDDPAPAKLAEVQVDGDVAQQARCGGGQGAAEHRQEGLKAILQADVDRLNGAGDGNEGTQQEKQHSSGGDVAEPFGGEIFHNGPPEQVVWYI